MSVIEYYLALFRDTKRRCLDGQNARNRPSRLRGQRDLTASQLEETTRTFPA